MIDSFRARYGLTDGKVTPGELSRADHLSRTKFTSPQWTARVP
jgi:lipoate-protein ligase A